MLATLLRIAPGAFLLLYVIDMISRIDAISAMTEAANALA